MRQGTGLRAGQAHEGGDMRAHRPGFKRHGGRWLADFGLVLALFWVAAFALSANHNRAHAVPLPTPPALQTEQHTAMPVLSRRHAASSTGISSQRQALAAHTRTLVLLSLTVASLAALNLAFWRHLRRAYASPRRGVWRRG